MQNSKVKMQKSGLKLKTLRFYILFFAFAFYLLTFFGCETVPPGQVSSVYEINGVQYMPLLPLCKANGIAWSYDIYAQTINLTKDLHRINMRVGDNTMLVDGQQQYLHHPVDIHQGELVVPLKFREYISDMLARGPYVTKKAPVVISNLRRVIIDPGHGGTDPGAISRAGLKEKNVNLDIALRLAHMLKESGVEVIMTRNSDIFIALSKRSDIANRSGADLFISIHANANPTRGLNGFEVYYVSNRIGDYQRASLAARNSALKLNSASFGSRSHDLKVTLWDMIYTNNRAESIELGKLLCRAMDSSVDVRIIGVKGANFYVLRNANIPAVLIEVGFLSNTQEERRLRDGFYRQQVAESIFEGIGTYDKDAALIMEASRR